MKLSALSWAGAAMLCVLSVTAASAQDIVGSSSIKGRPVELLSDNTWRYKSAIETDCRSLGYRMEFCGQTLGWVTTRDLSPEAAGSFMLNARYFAVVIAEPFGAEMGMSLETLGKATIINAATGANIAEQDIVVNSTEDVTVLDFPARRMSYTLKVTGLVMTFISTFWVEDDQSGQFITWTPGPPDEIMMKTHIDALATLRSVK
jgi:hypothetical protein